MTPAELFEVLKQFENERIRSNWGLSLIAGILAFAGVVVYLFGNWQLAVILLLLALLVRPR